MELQERTTVESKNMNNTLDLEAVNSDEADNKIATDEEHAEWKPSQRVRAIVAVNALVLFVVAVDSTILITALPTLAEALNANATQTFWIATSYLLSATTFQPAIAALADVAGRKYAMFISVALFTMGSVICCAANTYVQMLVGRTIQGIGGGGEQTMNLIILSDLIPLRQRARYMGYVQLIFAIGTIIGPIIGGVFAEHSWRGIFYLNLPFCAAGLLAVPIAVKYKASDKTLSDRLSSVDWIGILGFLASITVFLVGVSWGGNLYAWDSAATLCPIILGAAGLLSTGLWEAKGSTRPFIRLSLWTNISGVVNSIGSILQSLVLYAGLYYFTFYLTSVKFLSPLAAGIGVLPCACLMVPTSVVTGSIIAKIGHFRWAIWAGWVLVTLSNGLLIMLDAGTPRAAWICIFMVGGIGQGFLFMALSVAAQAIASPRHVTSAASMYAFTRSLGLCIGVNIGGTIFQNLLSHRLTALDLPSEIATDAEGYVAAVLGTVPDSVEKRMIIEAFVWSFQRLFAALTVFAGLAMLLSLCIKTHSLDKELESEHVLNVD